MRLCVESLEKKGMKEAGLFKAEGKGANVAELRAKLAGMAPNYADQALEGFEHDDVAAFLKLLFKEQEPPVLPNYTRFVAGLSDAKALKTAMAAEQHRAVLERLCAFLATMCDHTDKNAMDADALAKIWAPLLFHSRQKETIQIVKAFITEFDTVFED